ncbi:MAG: 16S rRNA (guanine(966)-N(2))-methyltransferase RsmD [Pseudomonadota bacterium]
MRIVGGKFRGRRLAQPKSMDIRPTTDRTRESLFNILNSHDRALFDDARVLDCFAGTGALGLEAVSRGARFAVFMDISAGARGLLRTNVENLGLNGHTKVLRRDACKPGTSGSLGSFDVVFTDPPYGKGLGEKALLALLENSWLNEGATVILEERQGSLPTKIVGLKCIDQRRFGETEIGIFQFVAGH